MRTATCCAWVSLEAATFAWNDFCRLSTLSDFRAIKLHCSFAYGHRGVLLSVSTARHQRVGGQGQLPGHNLHAHRRIIVA